MLSAVVLVCVAFVAPSADASRSLPALFTDALEPELQLTELQPVDAPDIAGEAFALFTTDDLSLLAAFALLDATERGRLTTENRYRLFAESGALPRPVELAVARKLASGVSTCGLGINIRQTGGLGRECVGPSFQGLWTDPVTGIAYARNRWYDARTASWLSEDPLGAVDSPNLYAFVGWGPHAGRDPMGEAVSRSKSGFTVITMEQGNMRWVVSRREAMADTERFRRMLRAGGMTALEASEYIVGLSRHEHAFKAAIDPGHGQGPDRGAQNVAGAVFEKDEALEVSLELRDALERQHNVEVVMTREADLPGPPGLAWRGNLANAENADVFVSVHLNAARRPGASGMEVYYERNPPDASYRRLAQSIAGNQTVMTPLRQGDPGQQSGVKQANWRVLTASDMPGVLVEVGFISTPAELAKIQTNRQQLSSEIAVGITEWYCDEEMRRMLAAIGMVP